MHEIDFEGLDEAALMAPHERIVERLHFLHQQRTTAALQESKIGSEVTVESPDGRTIRGKARSNFSVHRRTV
ncbi:hypothetical protein [Rhizobium sp. NPDC090279]|uniref:hypothetical protein n=1 Tax=Rhizobium sp. NPDC090279 TaxID=3364499 RepID=UPI00383A9AC8